MRFVKDLFLGYNNYGKAIPFIIQHKLWRYLLFPLILFGAIFYSGYYFEGLKDANIKILEGDLNIFEIVWVWMKKITQGFLSFLFLDATKYVVMIILSPLLAILSEKTENILTGNKYKFNLKHLITDVKRGISIAIRLLIAENIILWLFWFPISQWIFGFDEITHNAGKVIIGFYFYGFGYLDYVNERLRMSMSESFTFIKKHIGLAIAIGSVFSLLFYVPSLFDTNNKIFNVMLDNLGVIIAPVWAIVAATLAMHKLVDLNKSKYAVKKEK